LCGWVWFAGAFEVRQEPKLAADSDGGDREDAYGGADEKVMVAVTAGIQ